MKESKDLKYRLYNLLSIKSIVTIILTVCLVALLFSDKEINQELLALYCTSYGSVMTYFFTKMEN